MTKPFYEVRDFNNVRELIDTSADIFGERPAFEIKRSDSVTNLITYTQYRNDINALSTALIDAGISGGCAAICSDNCYEYCMTYISTICSGAVIAPVDKELFSDDIIGILRAADAKILFCDKKILAKLDLEAVSDIRVIGIGEYENENIESFESFLNRGRKLISEGKELYKDIKQDPEKLCTLLFTSGTTGVSKGVMLCQKNFVFEIKAAMGVIKIYPEDCGISLLPFHHTFESSIMIFFAPYCGAKVTFCEGFKYVLRNMKEFNPSVFVAVPQVLETVHKRIMKEIHKDKKTEKKFRFGVKVSNAAGKVGIDLRRLFFRQIQDTFGGNMRMIVCGGASIDPQILKDFDSFGIRVIFGYGLTECAPLAIINNDRVNTTDSIGVPLPGVEAKIYAPDADGVGEICVKGDMVMLGYYKNPEATAEVIDEDGFFHTGDLGFKDEKGCYHISGRSKNVIVTSNGKNIYPEELEYHLNLSPFVNSCMVEEVKNKKGEAEIHAQIYPEMDDIAASVDGSKPQAEEIRKVIKGVIDDVNSKLPGFKKIRSFTVREQDFIRTTAQKIKRESNKTPLNKVKEQKNG